MNSDAHFEAIVSELYEPLFRFAMSLTRAESDALDLTQQTFYIWATKGHQLRDRAKVKTWLFTTLHRTFLKARRKQLRFPPQNLDDVADELPVETPSFGDRVDSSQVLLALAKVNEAYQAAVALFYLEDCSCKDIAAILDVPIGTVKSRIARGIAQLREIMLSGDFNPASSAVTNVSARSATDEPVPLARRQPIRGREQTKAVIPERHADEWVFSPMLLEEPLGVL